MTEPVVLSNLDKQSALFHDIFQARQQQNLMKVVVDLECAIQIALSLSLISYFALVSLDLYQSLRMMQDIASNHPHNA